MTVLAAMIGCSFLIVLASVGFGIEQTLRNEILNDQAITQIELWGDEELSADDQEFIENVDHVNVVLNQADISGPVKATFDDREGEDVSPRRYGSTSTLTFCFKRRASTRTS